MGRSLSALSLYWRLDDMREISQETQEILKSQRMLGVNKYNYELKLEGVDFYSGINEIKRGYVIDSDHDDPHKFADFVIRSDGKVLFAYIKEEKIYLKIIENEQTMVSVNDIGADGDLFYTLSAHMDGDFSCFSLLRLKNGKILLFINDIGNMVGPIPMGTRVYISNNGLGDDFILHTILSEHNKQIDGSTYNKRLVSKGTQAENGDIFIMSAGDPYYANNFLYSSLVVYKSIDNGINWSIVHSYTGSILLITHLNNMVLSDNTLFITANNHHLGRYVDLFISKDYGVTWEYIKNAFNNLPIQHISNDWKYLIDFYHDRDNNLYLLAGGVDNIILYKYINSISVTKDNLNNLDNWEEISNSITMSELDIGRFLFSPNGTIHYLHVHVGRAIGDIAMIREEYSAPIKASSISISKGRGGANTLNLSIDNSNGAINPKNQESPLYNIINLNKQIIVKQGYGSDMIETFTGLIDSFQMKSYPHTIEISCRDHLKKALDQTITESGSHTVSFASQPIEAIFGYLCYLAGIETGEIDETGITISKEFSWQTYADAFQFLADLASFEYGADEYGKVYFKRDHQPDEIAIAYTFEEGLDITSLSYQLADNDLYYMVKVYGKSGDSVISYSAPFPDAAKYNIMLQKILKVDATEASTVAELKKIADRSIYLMNSRTAIVNFSAVAVPWLQVGDFIQVNESSSMSAGIYRISSLNLKMTDKDFLMDLQCYYYGDSIETGTLPEDTATQTGDPLLNLIPEMTSNTSPSGVARASSVLILYDNDYQPWNALNSTSDDLYWNAVSQYGWIEYQFTEKTIIDKYMLKARQAIDYNKAMPKNWTFEGFDGEKWITLDTQSNQTAWGIHEERSFDFDNTTAYAKYRLNVSANNGFHRLQLEQLAMYYRGGA